MRIVCLNIWKGKLLDQLISFLKREASTTDIFCFQEMVSALGVSSNRDADVFSVFARTLPEFQGFFEAIQDNGDGIEEGLAMFVKRIDPIDKEGDFFVYRTRNAQVGNDWRTLGRNLQFVQFPKSGKEYAVVNFHGLADGKGREDNENRISQSKKVKEFLKSVGGTKIICGDFNLTLHAKSLAVIEEGMRNFIRESGVTSTRPEQYFPYPDRYCDWMLADPSVKVREFRVLPDEVSDHYPLVLDFEA